MKIVYDGEGNFAFMFDKSERELEILLSIEPDSEEGYKIIDDAILALKYAGEEVPDNVTRIY